MWYTLFDVIIWLAGLALIWKAYTSWKGYYKLKLTSQVKKNLALENNKF